MSWKKKVIKINKKTKKILILLTCIVIFLVIILLSLLVRYFLDNMDSYYSIDSRIENVNLYKKKDTKDYNTVGWIKVQGTNIDFPILKGKSDSFDNPVEMESFGWIYGFDNDYHNVMNVFGHNIFNLSSSPKLVSDNFKRFEELMSFIYYDFAKENKYIQLTMENKDYIYKIFSVSIIYSGDATLFPKGEYTKSEKEKYLELIEKNNIYKYGVDVENSDNLISILTCTRFFGTDAYRSILVSGRLLRKGEKLNNYSIKKSNNYKKIEEVLKGDDGNEEIGSA